MLSSIHLKSVDLSTKYAFLTGLALKLYKIKADNWITWHAHKTHLDVSEACKRKPQIISELRAHWYILYYTETSQKCKILHSTKGCSLMYTTRNNMMIGGRVPLCGAECFTTRQLRMIYLLSRNGNFKHQK